MKGPRAPTVQEYPSVLSFLDQSLRSEQGWSIQSEYPTAFSQSNLSNMRIIEDGTDVLSHAVLRPILVKTPIGFFKVAAIGSVVTHEKYRNQGLSRQIIDDCLQLANDQTCDFAILWTNLYEFYRKLGFELAGHELSFKITEPLVSVESTGLRFLASSKVDPAALYRLYSQQTVATVRTIEEIRKYLEIPNSRVYTAWDHYGNLQAYAVEGKGADLDGYIHEWGGGVSKVLALLNYIQAQQNRTITLIAPAHAQNLIRQLGERGLHPHYGYLGMLKIIQTKGLFSKIMRHARLDFGLEDFILANDSDSFIVGLKSRPYRIRSEMDLIHLIFGPHRADQFSGMDNETKEMLQKIFPVKMWLWGWDSV